MSAAPFKKVYDSNFLREKSLAEIAADGTLKTLAPGWWKSMGGRRLNAAETRERIAQSERAIRRQKYLARKEAETPEMREARLERLRNWKKKQREDKELSHRERSASRAVAP